LLNYFQSSNLASNLGEGGSFFAGIQPTESTPSQPPKEDQLLLPSSNPPSNSPSNLPSTTNQDLELDQLNQHPCMGTILKLIDSIQEKFGAQNDPHAMPQWMMHLHSKFLQPSNLRFSEP